MIQCQYTVLSTVLQCQITDGKKGSILLNSSLEEGALSILVGSGSCCGEEKSGLWTLLHHLTPFLQFMRQISLSADLIGYPLLLQ